MPARKSEPIALKSNIHFPALEWALIRYAKVIAGRRMNDLVREGVKLATMADPNFRAESFVEFVQKELMPHAEGSCARVSRSL